MYKTTYDVEHVCGKRKVLLEKSTGDYVIVFEGRITHRFLHTEKDFAIQQCEMETK